MKLTKIAIVFGLAGALSGCLTTDEIQTAVSATVADIQAAAATVCKIVPTAGTVNELLTSGVTQILDANPAVTAAVAIATALCNGAAPMASGPGSSLTPGYVKGDNGHLTKVRIKRYVR